MHHAVLTGGRSTEMWGHEADRRSTRQHQETLSIPGFTGRTSITQVEGLWENAGNSPRKLKYWEGYQVGGVDIKEQVKDCTARTGVQVGS